MIEIQKLGSNNVINIAKNLKNFKKLANCGLKFVSSGEEIKSIKKYPFINKRALGVKLYDNEIEEISEIVAAALIVGGENNENNEKL